jgi:hypothetical protein
MDLQDHKTLRYQLSFADFHLVFEKLKKRKRLKSKEIKKLIKNWKISKKNPETNLEKISKI